MMDKETAEKLSADVSDRFVEVREYIKEVRKTTLPKTVGRDLAEAAKRAISHIDRAYGKWRSIIYTDFKLYCSDHESDTWDFEAVTDLDMVLGNQSEPKVVMSVTTEIRDKPEMINARYAKFDNDDVLMNALEACTTTIPDDFLLPLNFVGGLGKDRYTVLECKVVTPNNSPKDRYVEMSLFKNRGAKAQVIKLEFFVGVVLENIMKNLVFIHKVNEDNKQG